MSLLNVQDLTLTLYGAPILNSLISSWSPAKFWRLQVKAAQENR